MVSRTILAGTLAVLSSRGVIAGPCRPISSSTDIVSYSSAGTDSASVTVVFSSTETLSTETETLSTETLSTDIPSTETLSTETLSSETLETSLILPTTDVTISTVIEEATTTTAEGFTTTELATSDATSYQTTEATISESATTTTVADTTTTAEAITATAIDTTTTAADTTTTTAEPTTTAAYAVPTAFKLISDRGDTEGRALEAANAPASYVFVGDVAGADVHEAIFGVYPNGQLYFEYQTLCLYRDGYDWNAQIRTCPTDYYEGNERFTPLFCANPTGDKLSCRMQGSQCDVTPSEETIYCGENDLEFSQFFVRPYFGSSYLLYYGIDHASAQELNNLQLQPVDLEILGV